MDAHQLEREKRALIDRYGPWTASNIHLGGEVYTIGRDRPCVHSRMVRFGQIIADLSGRPLSELRILDLGCHEGEYAVEFARRGARVVGVEGRRANFEKARLAKNALGLEKLQLECADVRNISVQKYGTFDAVLCSGILYHLDRPDVVAFLESIGAMCSRCVLVDTHISFRAGESFAYKGRKYWGRKFIEHHRKSSPRDREESGWASLDNVASFWLTRPSLYNALTAAGFTSVLECHVPPVFGPAADRIAVAGIKGNAYRGAVGPAPDIPMYWPEKQSAQLGYYARRAAQDIAMRLPYPITRMLRRLFGR